MIAADNKSIYYYNKEKGCITRTKTKGVYETCH